MSRHASLASSLSLVALAISCFMAPAQAQSSPFVSEQRFDDLVQATSGDRAFDDVRHLTQYHRTGGSRDFFAATEWIRDRAKAAGLEDVRLIRQAWDGVNYSCLSGEAWLVGSGSEGVRQKLASYDDFALTIADGSRTTALEAELVDVGRGTDESDYEGLQVSGKVVLASAAPGRVQQEAVWKRGALGVVSYATSRDTHLDAPDQIAWGRVALEAKDVEGVEDGTLGAFAIMISPRRGLALAREIGDAEEPLRLRVDIEAEILEGSEQAMVEGWIRGSEIHDQQIVLTSHIQEEIGSANDNGSGVASMLEVARGLTRLIDEGRIPRPRRDIRFWWVNELSSQPQYFRENPGEPQKMLLAINQDMVGAKQSWGGRVQYASRSPWSLPHALDDVMESVLLMVRDANTGLLTFRGTDNPPRFQKPILSIKGTRDPFHARMVPYYGSSDHHAFTPGPVGVPATALINWPDDWIHSSGDDLDNIDATQLQRNAVVVAAVASYFGEVDGAGARYLAAHVAARARGRLAENLTTAITYLLNGSEASHLEDRRWARNLLSHSYDREVAALGSVAELNSSPELTAWVDDLSENLETERVRRLAELDTTFAAFTGLDPLASVAELSEQEQEMEDIVFAPVDDLGTYFDSIGRADGGKDLHAILRFEVYNFADGKRNALQVYEAVRAEAMGAGDWYYGSVTSDAVLEALRGAVASGALIER
ncbi:MAG: M28 family peptidase [Thermoanaerobaculia bacterium]|nr:M28 family peptidase [Thermoanaerobaculia bacterium]